MRLSYRRPLPALEPLIEGYVVLDDRDGDCSLSPVRTTPTPYGTLSVNFSDRSIDDVGNRHPEVAFLGLQTGVRRWVSGASTLFVMVLLSPSGVMRFFPQLGEQTGNALRDLTDLWDRSLTERFRAAAASMLGPAGAGDQMDRWAISMLSDGDRHAQSLVDALHAHRQPSVAASMLDMSLRTFERRFRLELGLTPTELLNLERLQQSLKTTGRGALGHLIDDGFADQSHEIRHWRRYLGMSPGRYRKSGISPLARAMESADPGGAVFYL